MSTKREEPCPECGTAVLASDKYVPFYDHAGSFPVKQWFYLCSCGWTWVNEVQQQNNEKNYKKARRVRTEWLTEMGEVAPFLLPLARRKE